MDKNVFPHAITDAAYVRLLARAKQNQVKMFQARGYPLPASQEPFLQPLSSTEAMLLPLDADARQAALVATYPEVLGARKLPSITVVIAVKGAGDLSEPVRRAKTAHALLILSAPAGMGERKRATTLRDDGYKVEEVTLVQCMVDPTQTFLQPTYTRLTEDERKDFYARLRVDPSSMPLMYTSDPVARWYGWQPGDVIRCIRPGLLGLASPSTVSYRRIAKGQAPSKVMGSDALALYSR